MQSPLRCGLGSALLLRFDVLQHIGHAINQRDSGNYSELRLLIRCMGANSIVKVYSGLAQIELVKASSARRQSSGDTKLTNLVLVPEFTRQLAPKSWLHHDKKEETTQCRS